MRNEGDPNYNSLVGSKKKFKNKINESKMYVSQEAADRRRNQRMPKGGGPS